MVNERYLLLLLNTTIPNSINIINPLTTTPIDTGNEK